MDLGVLLIGMSLGAAVCLGLQAYLERPQKRPTPTPIGAQWTREAAETLVREWSK